MKHYDMRRYLTSFDVRRLPKDSMDYFTKAELQGNVLAPWQWGGYISWRSDKLAQVYVDTRIEPFTMAQIRFPLEVREKPARYLNELTQLGTEFLILPVDKRWLLWEVMDKRELISVLYKSKTDFVVRLQVQQKK